MSEAGGVDQPARITADLMRTLLVCSARRVQHHTSMSHTLHLSLLCSNPCGSDHQLTAPTAEPTSTFMVRQQSRSSRAGDTRTEPQTDTRVHHSDWTQFKNETLNSPHLNRSVRPGERHRCGGGSDEVLWRFCGGSGSSRFRPLLGD